MAHNPLLKELSDQDLIRELYARKRVREVEVTRMYYNEMKDVDGYIESIDKQLGALIGSMFVNYKVATITERDGSMPMNDTKVTNRNISVLVITPVITEAKNEVAAEKV